MDTDHTTGGGEGSSGLGLLMIAAGVAVFLVCSLVQGIGDSSMFSTTYVKPDGVLMELLVNVTFYPGWLATVALVGGGIFTAADG